ncbi:DUF2142 domain-containing protein [Nocardioides sp. SOB77]|uniref:DUF2142 domain-containing protein n=1 Tax=Nocardioides oceani TaxID=3058369 RepID=A0ABT8FER1_9ACTN|nr:DUF2142 domain-containing protein [Nocardioides oceani]MDN4172955.1 DUF2142 domain-containing protein [Nocardioides oceani]
MTAPARAALWFVLGTLCLQAAWVLTVPPYRGLDEHEHAYKAAAVARGDWSPTHPRSPDGWGDRLQVPRDVVDSAHPVCESLPYTTPDNCEGTSNGDGRTTVASSAARYNPVFYALVGSAALPFDGVAALYAMRVCAALLCAFLLGAAAFVLARRGSSRWTWMCFASVLTPIVLYSSAVAAPNGVELASAVLVWVGIVGLRRDSSRSPAPDRFYLGAVAMGGLGLVMVRTLGPLWLVLILAGGSLLLGRPRVFALLRSRAGAATAGLLVVAGVAALGWTAAARTNDPGGPLGVTRDAWAALPGGWAMWLFQSVAAFPARDEIAPLGLYAVTLTVWTVILLVGLRAADHRLRRAVALVVVSAVLVPSAATLLTHAELGIAWQGRYSYPLALGALLLCAAAKPPLPHVHGRLAVALVALTVVVPTAAVELIGVLDVVRGERLSSPLAGTDSWFVPPDSVLALLVVSGATAWGVAVAVATRSRHLEPEGPAPGRLTLEPSTLHR